MSDALLSTKETKSTGTNVQRLPQTEPCPLCDQKFTRVAHLMRHLRAHNNDRMYHCTKPGCDSHFTRSDLLRRHLKTCGQPLIRRSKRLSCEACAKSKVRCDLQQPCAGCSNNDKECVYINDPQISRNKLRLKEEVRRAIDLKAARCGVNIENNVSMPAMFIEPAENPSTTASSSVVTSAPEPLLEDSLVIDHLCSLDIITGDPPCYSQIDDDHSALNTLLLGTGPDAEMLLLQDSEPHSNSPALEDSQTAAPTLSLAEPFESGPFDMVSCPSHSILPGKEEQYMSMFWSSYLPNMLSPVLHAPSYTPYGKPWILLRVMQTCGATTAPQDDAEAQAFVSSTFISLREAVIWEFTRCIGKAEQDDLILAVVLLLTIPCFCNLYREHLAEYHTVLCDMILKSKLLRRVEAWRSLELESNGCHPEETLDRAWRHWVHYETTKRMFLFAYSVECDDALRRSVNPSFHPNDMDINLVCDPSLFGAPTAADWLRRLMRGSPADAWGHSLRSALARARTHYNFTTVASDLDHCSRNIVIQSLRVLWYMAQAEKPPHSHPHPQGDTPLDTTTTSSSLPATTTTTTPIMTGSNPESNGSNTEKECNFPSAATYLDLLQSALVTNTMDARQEPLM